MRETKTILDLLESAPSRNILDIGKYERSEQWMEWLPHIPTINFPDNWEVQIIPPFGGALIRFRVKLKGSSNTDLVSICLDVYDRLGFVQKPYWELYPHDDGCFRCLMAETDELLEAIKHTLEGI